MLSPKLGGGLTQIFSLMKLNDLCQDLQKQNKTIGVIYIYMVGGSCNLLLNNTL